jgi:hypothetical protein
LANIANNVNQVAHQANIERRAVRRCGGAAGVV